MRVRILIGAAIVTGGWVMACSRPAPTATADRHIQLAEPASVVDTAVVSDIEARRAQKLTTVARREPSTKVSQAALVAAMPHMMGGMATSETANPRSLGLAAAPLAPVLPSPAPAIAEQGSASGTMTMSRAYQPPGGFIPSDGNYGPMVLIRGGMGGIDDKCDLRGNHRPGQAVNRSAPAFGPRGGIR